MSLFASISQIAHPDNHPIFGRMEREESAIELVACDCGRHVPESEIEMLETVLGGELQLRPHCAICADLWREQL